jgi:1,4-alpha-glucan branching enzyme
MQPRHTETSTMDRPATTPKPRSTTPSAAEKSATAKPTAEKPREQRSKDKTIEFRLTMPQAQTVAVAGTFNNWDTKRNPLQKDGTNWRTSVLLAPGRYEYRFVADGQWLNDPNAKETVGNDFGSTNSVLVV